MHGPRDWAAGTAGGPSSVVPDYLGRVTEASCHRPILCGLQVREVAAEAIARARRGDGPTLIEAETYRFRGHSLADPDELRQKEEKDHYQVRGPMHWLSCLLEAWDLCVYLGRCLKPTGLTSSGRRRRRTTTR